MMLKRQQKGIALLEAMIATIMLAIGLLGTIAMQTRAYSAMNDASLRAEATLASQEVIGLMNTDVPNVNLYAMASCAAPALRLQNWCEKTLVAIPNAAISVAVAPSSDASSTAVTVTIAWQLKAGPATTANRSTMTSYLAGSQ